MFCSKKHPRPDRQLSDILVDCWCISQAGSGCSVRQYSRVMLCSRLSNSPTEKLEIQEIQYMKSSWNDFDGPLDNIEVHE